MWPNADCRVKSFVASHVFKERMSQQRRDRLDKYCDQKAALSVDACDKCFENRVFSVKVVWIEKRSVWKEHESSNVAIYLTHLTDIFLFCTFNYGLKSSMIYRTANASSRELGSHTSQLQLQTQEGLPLIKAWTKDVAVEDENIKRDNPRAIFRMRLALAVTCAPSTYLEHWNIWY